MSILNLLDFTGRYKTPVIMQNEAGECGLACLAMVASHFGYRTDINHMRRISTVSSRGAALSDLILVADKLNLNSRAVKLELTHLNKLKLPAILHWDFNHFVVITQIKKDKVVLHDPATGKRIASKDEVSQHFTGVALELMPNNHFMPAKQKENISLRNLLGKVKGLGKAMTMVLLLALSLEVFTIASPLFMQLVVDSAIVAEDYDLLTVLGLGFLLLALISVAITALRSWVLLVLGTQLNIQLITNLFRHLLKLPLGFFEKRHLGDIVSRFDSMNQIQRTLTTSFLEAIIDGLMVITTLIMMFIYSPMLTMIVVAAALSYAIVRITLYRPLRAAQEEEILRQAHQHTNFLETVRGIQSIKLFNREQFRHTNYQNLLADQFNATVRVQRLGILFKALNGLIFAVENVAVIWLGAMLILGNEFSVGMLFAFIAYKQQFINRSTGLIEKGVDLKMLNLHTERVADIALEPPEVHTESIQTGLMPSQFNLTVDNVSFRYGESEPYILDKLSFGIQEGEFVAIVGPSGCGKTTLLKIMLGLLEPSSGRVTVGNMNLSQLSTDQYRQAIGTVMQDDQLFAGSIADNICFFDPQPDFERIKHAAYLAAIHDEIIQMPMHYYTMVGDMGTVLSGGQKQRILLARALYKKPQILFLDEATSHLDVLRENQVNEAIKQLKLTRVIIAHRPETIASADRVINLQVESLPKSEAAVLAPGVVTA